MVALAVPEDFALARHTLARIITVAPQPVYAVIEQCAAVTYAPMETVAHAFWSLMDDSSYYLTTDREVGRRNP